MPETLAALSKQHWTSPAAQGVSFPKLFGNSISAWLRCSCRRLELKSSDAAISGAQHEPSLAPPPLCRIGRCVSEDGTDLAA